MPDEDGYELIAKVRSRGRERGGGIPAIALSAYTRPDDRLRATAAGFEMHVCKPIVPEALVDMVANLAGKMQEK
jgi:CheY-like chemotaxis protein